MVMIGRGVGMVICYCPYWARVWHGCGFFNITARSSDLVPHKHSFL